MTSTVVLSRAPTMTTEIERYPFTYYADQPHVYLDTTGDIFLETGIAKGSHREVQSCKSHKRQYEHCKFRLNDVLGYRNGQIGWHLDSDFSDIHVTKVELIEGHKVHIEYKDIHRHLTASVTIDITQHLTRGGDGGGIEYVPEPIVYPNEIGFPGYSVDPLKDGNIQASSFTVASDIANSCCRVAYKTQIDDKVAMAERLCVDGTWSDATEIETWASRMPGANFALVLDPTTGDPTLRHLFFSEPDGDGYIYQQTCKHDKWEKPRKPRDLHGKEMAIKAHRFSGFAATYDHKNHIILFYFVDESNSLLEYAGKFYEKDGSIPAGYRWTRTQAPDAENLTLREHIAAIARDGKTYLVYRGRDHELVMAIGSRRKPWPSDSRVVSKTKRGDKRGDAEWAEFVIREKTQLAKYSPLAVAVGPEGEVPKVFYLHKDRKTETIMALDIREDCNVYQILAPVPVGKLEPGSDIGAASLPHLRHSIRVFSVSKLDGDNVLIDRVQNFHSKDRGYCPWVIAGGIVDTDIDHLTPRSLDDAHTRTDDD